MQYTGHLVTKRKRQGDALSMSRRTGHLVTKINRVIREAGFTGL